MEYSCGDSVPCFINEVHGSGQIFIGQTQNGILSEQSENVDTRTKWQMLFFEYWLSFVVFQTKRFQSMP